MHIIKLKYNATLINKLYNYIISISAALLIPVNNINKIYIGMYLAILVTNFDFDNGNINICMTLIHVGYKIHHIQTNPLTY